MRNVSGGFHEKPAKWGYKQEIKIKWWWCNWEIWNSFQPCKCLTPPENWHKTYRIYAAETAKCANALIIPVSTVSWIAVSPWVSQLHSHFHEGYSFQIIISASFPRVCGLATFLISYSFSMDFVILFILSDSLQPQGFQSQSFWETLIHHMKEWKYIPLIHIMPGIWD